MSLFKSFKWPFPLCVILSISLLLSGCGGGDNNRIIIAIDPTSATLHVKESKVFKAKIDGNDSTAVTWNLSEGSAAGSITQEGLYTASDTPGDYHIIAVSQADPGRSAVATILVIPPAGSLDTSFGINGKVLTPIGTSSDTAFSGTIQSDGKIIAAGRSLIGANNNFALTRYDLNGNLDQPFGTDGKVITSIGVGNNGILSVAIQENGKILATGYSQSSNGGEDFALARYDTSGQLDATFGSGGQVSTSLGAGDDAAYAVAIQSDQKIIAGGWSSNGSNDDFVLVRYNTNGTLDSTFGSNGKVITPIGPLHERIFALAIQADGKILTAGYTSYDNATKNAFALVRYLSNGTIDTHFGTDGKVITAIGIDDEITSVVILDNGKILAGGVSDKGDGSRFALARYNSDGSLDTNFGIGGIVKTETGSDKDVAFDLVVQRDGKILLAGDSKGSNGFKFAIVRYNADGSMDQTFGDAGKIVTSIGNSNEAARAIVIQPDNKIVAIGSSLTDTGDDFALVRYWP